MTNELNKPKQPKTTERNVTPKHVVHSIGVEHVATLLLNHDIPTTSGAGRGVDLVLNNGTTILVRAMSGDGRLPLMNGSLDVLKADYLVIVTNLSYPDYRRMYIMAMPTAKLVCVNSPYVHDNRNDFFIDRASYVPYRDNYTIITDGQDILDKAPDTRRSEAMRTPTKKELMADEAKVKAVAKAAERTRFRADYEKRHNIIPE